nr:dNTP triphosphohydrolase [Pseudomarimonas arenosa]
MKQQEPEKRSLGDRADRRSPTHSDRHDSRSPFQKDRDRVLYCDYFSRLSGVTQVVSSAEGSVFHNRLTHSLKVAQVARRLAERLVAKYDISTDLLNPDVVETAALAHDLGHPPFGHAAEMELCKLAEKEFGLPDGFEGNAQTFRILTRLATSRSAGVVGLDLTRASLAAVTKYPWRRDLNEDSKDKARRKFGAYEDDLHALDFAIGDRKEQSLEAQIMDVADAITYSVHDLEDFYRAGLIPLERLMKNRSYLRAFFKRWERDKPNSESRKYMNTDSNFQAVENLLDLVFKEIAEPGTQKEAELLEGFRSQAITQFLAGIEYDAASASISLAEEHDHQTNFLQRLVWDYVILSPRLSTQQTGQVRVVRHLARHFHEALTGGELAKVPTRFRATADELYQGKNQQTLSRLAIDIVASLSEAEALAIHRKIMGQASGSVLDLVR